MQCRANVSMYDDPSQRLSRLLHVLAAGKQCTVRAAGVGECKLCARQGIMARRSIKAAQ